MTYDLLENVVADIIIERPSDPNFYEDAGLLRDGRLVFQTGCPPDVADLVKEALTRADLSKQTQQVGDLRITILWYDQNQPSFEEALTARAR